MKKRTYKQMQNRLYREIKRRIIAEKQLLQPVKYKVTQINFETLKVRRSVYRHYINAEYSEHLKKEIAYTIADKLLENGYIDFYTANGDDNILYGFEEIEARLKVIH